MRCICYCCLKIFERKDLKLIQERSCEITCNHGTFLPKYLPGSCAKTLVYRRTITVTRGVENAISVPLNCHIEWIAWLFMLSTPMRNVLLHGMSWAYDVTFLAGMQIYWKSLRKKRVEQHGRRFTVLENHYRCLDVMCRLCACFTPEISRGNFLSCHAGFYFCIPILFLVELITLSFGCRFDTGICHDTSLDYVLCQSSECGGRSTLSGFTVW